MNDTDDSTENNPRDGFPRMDPGLMVLVLGAQLAFLVWFVPEAWGAYSTGGVHSLWQIRPSFDGLSTTIVGLLGGYANPNDHGAAAYAFNWLYTLFLFVLLMGFIVVPVHFRQKVNEIAGVDRYD